MMRRLLIAFLCCLPGWVGAQINTDRVMAIARNALFFEDYVLSIQYFNQVISAKPICMNRTSIGELRKSIWRIFKVRKPIVRKPSSVTRLFPDVTRYVDMPVFVQHKVDGAIEDYKKALEYDPENSGLWNNLALLPH